MNTKDKKRLENLRLEFEANTELSLGSWVKAKRWFNMPGQDFGTIYNYGLADNNSLLIFFGQEERMGDSDWRYAKDIKAINKNDYKIIEKLKPAPIKYQI